MYSTEEQRGTVPASSDPGDEGLGASCRPLADHPSAQEDRIVAVSVDSPRERVRSYAASDGQYGPESDARRSGQVIS